MNTKDRRHSGRVSTCSTIPAKKDLLLQDPSLIPEEFWDDWIDYRDGFRGYPDKTKIQSSEMAFADYLQVKRWNRKNKKMLKRRLAAKRKRQFLKSQANSISMVSMESRLFH